MLVALAEGTTEAVAGGATMWTGLLSWVVIIGVFYFILIMPQRKRDKKTKAMLEALKVGDEILTVGGIYGKIIKIKDDIFTIEVGSDKTKLKIARWSIRSLEREA